MGRRRTHEHRYLWTALLIGVRLCVPSLGGEEEPLSTEKGFGYYSEFEPGLNLSIQDYRSCTKNLLESVGRLGVVCPNCDALPAKAIELGLTDTASAFAGTRRVPLVDGRIFPDLKLGLGHVLHVGEHKVMISMTDTLHKSIGNQALFDGYYVLYPVESIGELLGEGTQYLRTLRAPVLTVKTSEQKEMEHKSFYLFSVAQFAELSRDDFEPELWAPPKPVHTPSVYSGMPFTPGVVKTGRGTVYHFLPSGNVVVQPRSGPEKRYSFQSETGYASHAAILRRQGVTPAKNATPLELTYTAMKNVNESVTADVPKKTFEMHLRTLDQVPLEPWTGLSRDILESAETVTRHLPEFLRWSELPKSALYSAPKMGLRSEIFSFVLIRGSAEYQRSVFITQAIHMQIAYANLFTLALELDRKSLLTGGAVEVKYDEDGHARQIELLGNDGMMSVAHQKRVPMTDDEVTWLLKKIESSAPFDLRKHLSVRLVEE